jgi:hypothetical protein
VKLATGSPQRETSGVIPRPGPEVDPTAVDPDAVFVVVVAGYVRLGDPGSLEVVGLDGGADVEAGCGDEVTAPGVVDGVRPSVRRTDVADGTHGADAPDTADLHAESVGDAGADGGHDRGKVGGRLVQIERMGDPADERGVLGIRPAGLFEDHGEVAKRLGCLDGLPCSPALVGVGGQAHPRPERGGHGP